MTKRASGRGPLAVAIGFLVIVVAACGGDDGNKDQGAEARASISVTLPFESVIEYPSFYLAERLGYFADEGLKVDLKIADGSSAAIQQLIVGNTEMAVPSPTAFLQAVARGQNLRWVYSYLYKNIFTLAVPADSDIESVVDLRGKKIGVSDLAGGEVPLVEGVLGDAGLKGGDYELVPVGEGSALTAQALESGQVDAYSSNVFDVAAIELAGVDLNTILPKAAAAFPADGVVVTAEYLESNQGTVAALARALSEATVFANENSEAAYEMAQEIAPEEFEDKDFSQAAWDVAVDLRTPPKNLENAPIGSWNLADWQAYQDFLLKGSEAEGGLSGAVDLHTALDDSILKAANDFDRSSIQAEADKSGG